MSDILWAGWRARYVKSVDSEPPGECLFCRLPRGSDEEGLLLERGATVFSVLNLYPYTTGHLMVVPYRHVAGPADLEPEERDEMWRILIRGEEACRRVLAPQGFNIGANLGRVAGAGIPGHLHFHLVPRWAGDTNFMATVGETRVMPESVEATWRDLRAALAADLD